nr:MAG TPA: hypothetical protein [Caudoviricetes sp.]
MTQPRPRHTHVTLTLRQQRIGTCTHGYHDHQHRGGEGYRHPLYIWPLGVWFRP